MRETFIELIHRLDTTVDQAVNHDTLTGEINSPKSMYRDQTAMINSPHIVQFVKVLQATTRKKQLIVPDR
jgi:hypothetical protein